MLRQNGTPAVIQYRSRLASLSEYDIEQVKISNYADTVKQLDAYYGQGNKFDYLIFEIICKIYVCNESINFIYIDIDLCLLVQKKFLLFP